MTWQRSLVWLIAAVIVWAAINSAAPRVAGVILAAFVIFALIQLGPQLAKIPKG